MTENVKITKANTSFANIIVEGKRSGNKDDQLLLDRLNQGSEKEKKLITRLNEYHQVMQHATVNEEDGIKQQVSLFNTLNEVLNKSESSEFRTLWSIVLLFAKVHRKDSFDSNMLTRYTYLWSLGEEKMRAFLNISNIIMLTCDPATRARNVKFQIDFSKSTERYYNADVTQKLISFYKS